MKIPTEVFGVPSLRAAAYAVVAVLFLVVLGFAGCQHQRAENEAAKRLAAEAGRDTAVGANKTLEETIERQNKALDAWAEIGVTPDEVRELLQQSNQYAKELEVERAANARLKEKDNANPECAALLRVDFERVCPHRARVLRQYESRDADGDRRGEGPGIRPPAGRTRAGALSPVPVPR